MASFVKKLLVRDSHMLPTHNITQELRSEFFKKTKTHYHFLPLQETPVRVPVRPVRSLVPCTPAVPTAPAKPWSVCGVAVCSAALTRLPMSSLFLMASAWSGRLEIVWVSVFCQALV